MFNVKKSGLCRAYFKYIVIINAVLIGIIGIFIMEMLFPIMNDA